MDKSHIPDSDLKLAREVGESLEDNRSVLSIDDPLIEHIIDHRQNLYSKYEYELLESREQSWGKISKLIHHSTQENHQKVNNDTGLPFFKGQNSSLLKAAAVILFAALLSVIFLRINFDQSEMLVQAKTDQVTYNLDDQSRVQLRPNSTLYLIHQSENEVRYKLEGEAFFNVTKNDQRKFLVDAGSGLIEVIGTSFNVREWSTETIVYLQNGTLSLSTADQSQQVILKPGETAAISSDATISTPVQSHGKEYVSWQQNELILNNRTVESIIEELEYHYSIEIQLPNEMLTEVLGGTLTLENEKLSLKNLGIVLGGNFSSIEDNTYQFVE